MRLSCNGCRILRKGCNEDCIIRPCLEWINSPESQANATLFLAKFYGRAGLLNLISAAPLDLRAAVFKSLIYEACGRVVNPAFGSLGLFWSGEWAQCEAAVIAVLNGKEITPMVNEPSDSQQPTQTRGTHTVNQHLGTRHVSNAPEMGQFSGRAHFRKPAHGELIRPKARMGSVDSAAQWNLGPVHGNILEASSMGPVRNQPCQIPEPAVDLELTLG